MFRIRTTRWAVVRVSYDNGSSVVYSYDSAGNRTSVVVVAPATGVFHGRISFVGRPAAPDPTWQVALHVDFLAPGTGTVLATASPTTDISGNFSVSSLTPGTYDVQIKFAQALSKLAHGVVVLAGESAS